MANGFDAAAAQDHDTRQHFLLIGVFESVALNSASKLMQGPKPNDTIDIPVLAVGDLYERRRTRDASRLRAYNKLLETIYHRIKVVSKMPTHPTDIVYTIPPFILGLPRLDLQDCVVYLVYQLRSQGFKVNYSYPNLLWISWKHHEQQYVVNESPILQAMLATTPQPAEPVAQANPRTAPARRRKDNGTAGANAETRTVNVMMLPPELQAKPLSAMDYSPPSGFINAVERPAPMGRPKSSIDDIFP